MCTLNGLLVELRSRVKNNDVAAFDFTPFLGTSKKATVMYMSAFFFGIHESAQVLY